MIENSKIEEIVDKIVAGFNPDKVILFGSYASGNSNEDSDLDLLVIKDTILPRHKRSFDIHKSLIGSMFPIDILVFTKNEYELEINDISSFLYSALKTSKVLYVRN